MQLKTKCLLFILFDIHTEIGEIIFSVKKMSINTCAVRNNIV